MIGNHSVVVVGNLTSDPELSFSESGTPFAKFTIAVNDGKRDDPKAKTIFHRVTAFNHLAENIAESLTKGAQVIATLRLDPWERTFDTNDGEKKVTQVDYIADEIGASLRFATAKISRASSHNDEREEPRAARNGNSRTAAREEPTDEAPAEAPAQRGRSTERATSSRGGSTRPPARSNSRDSDF